MNRVQMNRVRTNGVETNGVETNWVDAVAGYRCPGLPRAAGTTAGGRSFHIAFEVDDCYAAETFLIEKNVPVARVPKPRPDGAVQLYLFDPDNHVIELFSWP